MAHPAAQALGLERGVRRVALRRLAQLLELEAEPPLRALRRVEARAQVVDAREQLRDLALQRERGRRDVVLLLARARERGLEPSALRVEPARSEEERARYASGPELRTFPREGLSEWPRARRARRAAAARAPRAPRAPRVVIDSSSHRAAIFARAPSSLSLIHI